MHHDKIFYHILLLLQWEFGIKVENHFGEETTENVSVSFLYFLPFLYWTTIHELAIALFPFTCLSCSFYLFQKIQSLQRIRTLNTLSQTNRKGFVHFLLNTKIQSGF